MEEEFGGGQTRNIGILDEPARIGTIIVFMVMGKSARIESIGNTFSIHILLSQTRNHLGNINKGALGSRIHNHEETVIGTQTGATNLTRLFRRFIENIIHSGFEFRDVTMGCGILENTEMDFIDDRLYLALLCLNDFDDFLLRLLVGNQITNTDAVGSRLHIFRNNVLQIIVEIGAGHIAEIIASTV